MAHAIEKTKAKQTQTFIPMPMTTGTQTAILNVGTEGVLLQFDGIAGTYPEI